MLMEAKAITKSDPWRYLFKMDTILWRPVSISTKDGFEVKSLKEVTFNQTETGTFIAKVNFPGNMIWEPEVITHSVDRGYAHENLGIVLFVDEKPPENWTHLIITGVGNKLKEPGRQDSGGAIFATTDTPLSIPDYMYFRKRMAAHYDEAVMNHASFEKKLYIANSIWPRSDRLMRRLIVDHSLQEDEYFNYCHIVRENA